MAPVGPWIAAVSVGQRHHRPTPQQPDQPGLVVTRQAAVARVRPVRHRVEPEQVTRRPSQRLGLLAPLSEEAPAILDRLLPVGGLDVAWAAPFQLREGATKATKATKGRVQVEPAGGFCRLCRLCRAAPLPRG